MSAYQNDDSEESKSKIQQLKVDLEEARENLEETEYDKYISDQESLLDSLYTEYEEILNARLDNIDALLSDMILEINSNATLINDTLSIKADEVGYTLTETMSSIWNTGSDNMKNVLTTYGDGIKNSILTAGTTLSNAIVTMNTNINGMIAELNRVASSQTQTASSSSAANPQPTTTTTKTPTTTDSNTNNKSNNNSNNKSNNNTTANNNANKNKSNDIKVGSTINAKGAKIYEYAGDKSGETQYFRSDPVYTVIGEKNGYIKVRWHELDSGVTGWFKKSDVKSYSTGKHNFLSNEIAWTQDGGAEMIIRPSDGAILTPLAKGDSVLNAQASGNIWNMANNPSEFIRDNLGFDDIGNLSNDNSKANYVQNFDKIVFNMPNVHSYNEMLMQMQHDKNFERLISAMTIDRMAGKSSLSKGKAIR